MTIINGINRIISRIQTKSKVKDSGMRTNNNGDIYIDKKVFFERQDVKDKIKKIINLEEGKGAL